MIEGIMIWVWLFVFVTAIVVEAMTQEFVSIWFSVGALVAMIFCSFEWMPFWGEIIIFSVISLLSLGLTRPLVKKLTARGTRYTNVDEFVGKRTKLEKEVTKFLPGEIKVNGVIYSAILMEDVEDSISTDSIVEIVALKGNKIVVKKIEE